MPGLHPQSRRKKEKKAVDMSSPPDEPSWCPPGAEDCDESASFTAALSTDGPLTDRLKVRLRNYPPGMELVDFAVVHQTFHRGKWRPVVKADSSHDSEVHLHRYGRRGGEFASGTEQLMPIKCMADVAIGYDLAYDHVVKSWVQNRARWFDA